MPHGCERDVRTHAGCLSLQERFDREASSELRWLVEVLARPSDWCVTKSCVTKSAEGSQDIFPPGIDMDEIERLARYHQVVPLLVARLRDARTDLTASPVLRRMDRNAQANSELGFWNLARLAHVLSLFADAGIAAISLKGVPLSLAAYGSIGLRHHGDLDILVPEAEIERATAILARNDAKLQLRYTDGSRRVAVYADIAKLLQQGMDPRKASGTSTRHSARAGGRRLARGWSAFLRTGNEMTWAGESIGSIDLHWKLVRNERTIPLDPWMHQISVQLGSTDTSVLEPTAQIVYLLVHGAGHGWSNLRWLADVAYLLADDDADLALVADLASRLGLTDLVTAGLYLCALLFCSPEINKLEDVLPLRRRSARLAHRCARRLIAGPELAQRAHEPLANLLLRLHLRQGLRYRLRAVEDCFAPANWWLEMATWRGLRPLRLMCCMVGQQLGGSAVEID